MANPHGPGTTGIGSISTTGTLPIPPMDPEQVREIQLLAENAEERGLGIGFNGDGSSVHDKAKTAHSTTKSGQMGNVPSDDISGGSVDRIQSTPLNEQSRECDSE